MAEMAKERFVHPNALALDVPIPDNVVGSLCRTMEALLAHAQLFLDAGMLADFLPQLSVGGFKCDGALLYQELQFLARDRQRFLRFGHVCAKLEPALTRH